MSNNSNKKRTCPICYALETEREINDCLAARAWARNAIRSAEGQPKGNKYDHWDVARPRGANGAETY
jgi:hypothetical protein